MEIVEKTTLEAWTTALRIIKEKGGVFHDTDNRVCREILNFSVTILHPDLAADEPIDHIRKINKWFYPSKEELSNIIFNQYELPLYEYTYGSRLFNHQGLVDQINDYIIPLLKQQPTSRRATVSVLDPSIDMHMHNRNAPGLASIHFKIDHGSLRMTCIIRSNDFFIGWPANIYQLSNLQRYVAQQLSLPVGSLTTYSISAHIFDDYEEELKRVLE